MNGAWQFTLIPAAATVIGASAATLVRPRAALVAAIQHFAAGVVMAAAAAEILPDVMRRGDVVATLVGGIAGIAVMLCVKYLGARAKGRTGLLFMVGIDILIDGLVLGIGFAAGIRAGALLTLALTIEVLFLGLTVAAELIDEGRTSWSTITVTAALSLLLPVGAVIAMPVSQLPAAAIQAVFAFGLVALLYLVTEELLVEAHQRPDTPWITAAFFLGFLLIIAIEEATK